MTVRAEDLSATVTDVVEGQEYSFRVRAQNRIGVGKPSAATPFIKVADPIGKFIKKGEIRTPLNQEIKHIN